MIEVWDVRYHRETLDMSRFRKDGRLMRSEPSPHSSTSRPRSRTATAEWQLSSRQSTLFQNFLYGVLSACVEVNTVGTDERTAQNTLRQRGGGRGVDANAGLFTRMLGWASCRFAAKRPWRCLGRTELGPASVSHTLPLPFDFWKRIVLSPVRDVDLSFCIRVASKPVRNCRE
jgi:hypothetical protein